jgi:hypothetical protein
MKRVTFLPPAKFGVKIETLRDDQTAYIELLEVAGPFIQVLQILDFKV